MEKIIEYLREKSQLVYDLNCIRKYIQNGDYDNSLKRVWEEYNKELEEITKKINEYKKPQLLELKNKKMKIIASIKEYEEKISKLKQQLKDLDQMIIPKIIEEEK